jgi:hypothetical protein
VITQTLIRDNVIADSGYYPGPPASTPNGPGVTQGTTGIALIPEVGGTDTPAPVLALFTRGQRQLDGTERSRARRFLARR